MADAFDNSIALIDGRMHQTIHGKGFDYETFNRRGECVRAYLRDQCPNFYNKLLHAVPQKHITFCMMASIGEEGSSCVDENGNEEKSFKNYKPFCIDEPILSVLAKQGMYPIAVHSEMPKEEKVQGGTKWKMSGLVKKMIDAMKLDDYLVEEIDEAEDYEEV